MIGAAAAGLTAAAIWGGMYVVSKYVLDYVPPFTLVALRLAVASVVFLAVLRAGQRTRPSRADLRRIMLCGLVGFGVSLPAQFAGTRLSTAHDGALITSATPAFIVLFAGPLLGERAGLRRWLALAIATAGVLVVAGGDAGGEGGAARLAHLTGNALLVVAAITWALYTVLSKQASARAGALATTAYATLAGVVCTIPMGAAEQLVGPPTDWLFVPWLVWPGLLYLGVVSTAVAFYLWNKAFERLDAGLASLFFFAQPVVGGLLGWLLLDERLPPTFFAGAAAIVAGVVLASWSTTEPPRPLRADTERR